MVLKPVIRGPLNHVVRGIRGGYSPGLPNRSGLLAYYRGAVDTIGLSADDYAEVDETVRDIFFSDESTMRSAEDILTLAFASPYLNVGTMIGDGVCLALYASATDQSIIDRALRYFGILATYGAETAIYETETVIYY